jgi:hypothetical protein
MNKSSSMKSPFSFTSFRTKDLLRLPKGKSAKTRLYSQVCYFLRTLQDRPHLYRRDLRFTELLRPVKAQQHKLSQDRSFSLSVPQVCLRV